MLGAGKYDGECSAIRERLDAEAAILIVIRGDKGSGFSCHVTDKNWQKLPNILRVVADQIEHDHHETDTLDTGKGGFG